jgi:polyisoprenoid-binding protein YceI
MQTTVSNQTRTYQIDEAHSTIRFWARHMMIAKVHGELPDVTGTVTTNAENPEQTTIDVHIKTSSLSTNNEQRDGHLKSADFLNAEQYPEMTYKSTRVIPTGPGTFDIEGDLTIRGMTRPVPLKAEVSDEVSNPFGGPRKVGVTATGVVDREEFDMTWNQAIEAGGVLVGKEINFTIDLELDRQD